MSTPLDPKAQGFDTLSGLNIPLGTQSILFSFTRPSAAGPGRSEIQGFAAIPEPATYAMIFGGLAVLVLVSRFRGKLIA